MRDILIAAFILVFVLFPITSAAIFMSQPAYLYNAGDEMNFSVTLNPGTQIQDFLRAKLNCGESNIDLYNVFYSMQAGSQKVVNIDVFLTSNIVNNMQGQCFISAFYGNENVQSQAFELSRKIDVNAETNSFLFNPGNNIFVSGNSVKANGKKVEGYADVKISGTDIISSSSVKDGNFNASITLPSNLAAGERDLIVIVYDKDNSGKILNQGEIIKKIKINEVLKI